MLRESIVSLHNPLIKRFRAVREGRDPGHIFIEGSRLCQEALDANLRLESLIHTPEMELNIEAERLLKTLDRISCRGAIVTDKIMKHVCETVTPQGIAMIAKLPRWELKDLFAPEPFLILVVDGVQDPGNLGTMIRSAEAAGATGIAVTPGSVRAMNPKAVRASMGSLFRLPAVELTDLNELRRKLKLQRIPVYAASTSGEADYLTPDYTASSIFLVGSEAHGIGREAMRLATNSVRIPMPRRVNSLNAAIAASVLLFEAARQRRTQRPRSTPVEAQ